MAASLVLQLQELRTVIELLLDAVEERVGFFAGTRNRLLLDADQDDVYEMITDRPRPSWFVSSATTWTRCG